MHALQRTHTGTDCIIADLPLSSHTLTHRMDGDIDFTTGSNWHTWNTAQLERIRNDNGNSTDPWVGGMLRSIE